MSMKQISVLTNDVNLTINVGMKDAKNVFDIIKEISLIEKSNSWWEIIIKGIPHETFTTQLNAKVKRTYGEITYR